MILVNDYKDSKIRFRYYLQKYAPKILYPYLLKEFYKRDKGKILNLKSPKTLSEKINYLKLHESLDMKTILSDKLQAKEYVMKNIPELHCAKVYQICSSFEELNFSNLPKKFMLKTNHACKTGILILNKNRITEKQIDKYRKYYKRILKINYAFWGTLELQYLNIKPQIYAEEYLENNINSSINEYEVYCFNGEPKFLQYTINNKSSFDVTYLTTEWEKADFYLFGEREAVFIPDNKNREKILYYSRKISKKFKFARIDFFEVNNILYFGEVTFTPFSGNIKFVPEEYDLILGKELIL